MYGHMGTAGGDSVGHGLAQAYHSGGIRQQAVLSLLALELPYPLASYMLRDTADS